MCSWRISAGIHSDVVSGKLHLLSSAAMSEIFLGKSGIGLLLIPNSGFRVSSLVASEFKTRASLLTSLFNSYQSSQPRSLNK